MFIFVVKNAKTKQEIYWLLQIIATNLDWTDAEFKVKRLLF